MWRLPEPRFDVASALDQGNRDYQEDALVADFAVGDDIGIIVLADGMGGHAAGDVASKIVVTEVYSELKFHCDSFFKDEEGLPYLMGNAVFSANDCLKSHIEDYEDAQGMGATVIAAVLAGERLFWTSVGDSPLYHYRSGKLQQLNEDHSMAPQIDLMAETGVIKPEEAATHPDRNCLTSAVCGGKIARIDNKGKAFEMMTGDILVISSDGLQFLPEDQITKIISRNRRKPSADIANALLQALKKNDNPEQDNISFSVIKVRHTKPVERPVKREHIDSSTHSTRLAADVDIHDSETEEADIDAIDAAAYHSKQQELIEATERN
ncbi:MAG: serine/threonine-protein phosphatase [Silicimonas sp.]|nr:serine/threonine-protein phosphatase [Silicimonas sp.]